MFYISFNCCYFSSDNSRHAFPFYATFSRPKYAAWNYFYLRPEEASVIRSLFLLQFFLGIIIFCLVPVFCLWKIVTFFLSLSLVLFLQNIVDPGTVPSKGVTISTKISSIPVRWTSWHIPTPGHIITMIMDVLLPSRYQAIRYNCIESTSIILRRVTMFQPLTHIPLDKMASIS